MESFPNLTSFIRIYFGQDFDLIGDSIEALVADFVRSSSREEVEALRKEICVLLQQKNAETTFRRAYDNEMDPNSWGHTAESFLRCVSSLIDAKK